MSPYDKQTRGTSTIEGGRLETPTMAGYRAGMSSSGVIGRKLGVVYGVQSAIPREMDSAIRQLHSKLGPTR